MNPPSRPPALWPYGIVVAFALFIGGLATLITFAARQPSELVAADYYEQELRFQTQLDRQHRAHALPAPLRLETDSERHCLRLTFPADHARQGITGTLQLYRPSEAKLDRSEPLAPGEQGVQTVNIVGLAPGLWHARVAWRSGEQDYFVTEPVRIAKP